MTSLRRLTSLLYVCLALLLPAAMLLAQPENIDVPEPEPSFYIGAFGGYSALNHNVRLAPDQFKSSLDLPAAAVFQSGTGSGLQGGILFELPFSRFFAIGLRAGIQQRNGILTQSYTNDQDVVTTGGASVDAQVEGKIDAEFSYIAATPHIRITPSSLPIYFIAGPSILYPVDATHVYTETVTSPSGALFGDNRRKVRTNSQGDLSEASTPLAAMLGLGVDFDMGNALSLFVEGQYIATLGNVLDNLGSDQWTNSSLGIVAGVRIGIGGRVARVAPPPVVAARDTVANTGSRVRAGAVTMDGLSDTLTIASRNVRATEIHALLPYVFFGRDSAQIPSRYRRLDRKQTRDYQFERLDRGDALGIYHQALNIVGQRLRDNKKAKITLVGCMSILEGADSTSTATTSLTPISTGTGSGKAADSNGVVGAIDTNLALRRAVAIRDYLVDVWRVRPNRIEIVGRQLPENASLSEVDPRQAEYENMRVEFQSDDYSILAPVRLLDSAYLAPAGIIRYFPPQNDTSARTDSWSLDIQYGDSLVEGAATGYGPPPAQIDIPVANRQGLAAAGPVLVTGRFMMRDTGYVDIGRLVTDTILIRREGELVEQRNVVDGKVVETYNLLLYDFDSDALVNFTQQATTILQSKVTPASTVTVVGHTDRIGLPSYNKALSLRRAELAAQNLGIKVKEVTGLGEKKLLYDNSEPEGRYYCRTVTVTIETPEGAEGAVAAPDAP